MLMPTELKFALVRHALNKVMQFFAFVLHIRALYWNEMCGDEKRKNSFDFEIRPRRIEVHARYAVDAFHALQSRRSSRDTFFSFYRAFYGFNIL